MCGIQSKDLERVINETLFDGLSIFKNVDMDVKKTISESLGISLEVENATMNIKNKIEENAKTVEWKQNGAVKVKKGEFDCSVFNMTVSIKYAIINFITEEIFDALWQNFDFNCEYKPKTNEISVNIGMYNGGYITSTFIPSLQHELAHLYDNLKTKGYTFSDKDKNLYNRVTVLLSSQDKIYDKKVYDIGWCLYYSFKSERLAFANSFYSTIKQDIHSAPLTEEYQTLYFIKSVLAHWADYENYVSIFDMAPDKCYKIINNGYRELVRYIGRAYAKVKMEMINEDVRIEPRRSKPLKILEAAD